MAWAAARGHTHACLWSDVKFDRAHVMYERLGFKQIGIRDCEDIDKSREYGFSMPLSARSGAA